MATTIIQLPNIPQYWYLAWSISTQAANQICITLADSATTYVNRACRQSTQFGQLSAGFQRVQGTQLALTIDIAASPSIKTVIQPYKVPTQTGTIVGEGYTILVEDGDDDDYNDLCASLIAWQAEG